jgi:hypothetical protein
MQPEELINRCVRLVLVTMSARCSGLVATGGLRIVPTAYFSQACLSALHKQISGRFQGRRSNGKEMLDIPHRLNSLHIC